MTSPSRRKPPTTRPSTRTTPARSLAVAIAAALMAGRAIAADPYFDAADVDRRARPKGLGVWPWQMDEPETDADRTTTPSAVVPVDLPADPVDVTAIGETAAVVNSAITQVSDTRDRPSQAGPELPSIFEIDSFRPATAETSSRPADRGSIPNPLFPGQRPTDVAMQDGEGSRANQLRDFDDDMRKRVRDELDQLEKMDLDNLDLNELPEGGDDIVDDATASDDSDPIRAGQSKERNKLRPKSIADIVPFADYDPDGASGQCRYLCPRPGDCEPIEGERAQAYQCPDEIPLPTTGGLGRSWETKRYHWVASDVKYNPLYFEDPQLERYGQTYPFLVQPFVSTGRFMGQALLSPYLAAIDPPLSCVSPLGYYRPGECAPKLHPALPVDGRSAFEAALFYTGVIAIFP